MGKEIDYHKYKNAIISLKWLHSLIGLIFGVSVSTHSYLGIITIVPILILMRNIEKSVTEPYEEELCK